MFKIFRKICCGLVAHKTWIYVCWITSMKDHSYCPKPACRTYISKKNGKLRPLGIQSSDDKLVQQVMKMMLESIYEDTFTDTSHEFRL